MRLLDQLRATDERLVPRLAAGLRAGLDRLSGARSAGTTVPPRGGARRPAVPGALRRLDDRLASRGPLAAVRAAPQLGALVIGAVLLLGAVVALTRQDAGQEGSGAPADADSSAVGLPEQDYRAEARTRLDALVAQAPGGPVPALLSLSSRATPQQAVALAGGLRPRRVYLAPEAPPVPQEVAVLDVRDLRPELEAAFDAEAAGTQRRVAALRAVADRIESSRTAERDQAEQAVSLAEQQAAGWRARCACVVALVVAGLPEALRDLQADQAVRAVDPQVEEGAPATVRLLLPGEPVAARVPVRAAAA